MCVCMFVYVCVRHLQEANVSNELFFHMKPNALDGEMALMSVCMRIVYIASIISFFFFFFSFCNGHHLKVGTTILGIE